MMKKTFAAAAIAAALAFSASAFAWDFMTETSLVVSFLIFCAEELPWAV